MPTLKYRRMRDLTVVFKYKRMRADLTKVFKIGLQENERRLT